MTSEKYVFPTKIYEHCTDCNASFEDSTAMTFTGEQYSDTIVGEDSVYHMGNYKCDKCGNILEVDDNNINWKRTRKELPEQES